MKKLLIATKNPGKYKEMLEVLGDLRLEFLFLADLEVDDADFVEDGETFEENSLKKARYYGNKLGILTIGEDSGLLVDALAGELGVKTRRFGAGEKAGDEEWIKYFMKRMEGERSRGARFHCSACLYDPENGGYSHFNGETRGIITESLMAPIQAGIPLSSCFLAEGMQKVYAALSIDEKNSISHRGKAMGSLKEYLSANHCQY